MAQTIKKPPFTNFPDLFTERLILRQLTPKDVEDALPVTFYNGKPAGSLEEAQTIIKQINKDYEQGKCIHWGIAFKEHGKIIGTCGFYRGFEDNTGEIGYIIKEENRGAGIVTEAAKSIVIFGFNIMKINKIVAYTDADNPASQKVLLKMGFTEVSSEKEGLLKYEQTNFLRKK